MSEAIQPFRIAASDAELDDLMRKWRDSKPYDPRKGMG